MKREDRWIDKVIEAAGILHEFTSQTGQRLELLAVPIRSDAAIRLIIGTDGLRYDIFGDGTKALSRKSVKISPEEIEFENKKSETPMQKGA